MQTLSKIYKTFLATTLLLLATINLIKFFVKTSVLLRDKKKKISSIDKSIQIHGNNSNKSGVSNQEAVRESKENQSKALDNSVNNSNGKKQPNGSLRHHPDHINGVKSTGKELQSLQSLQSLQTVAIVGDSIIRNIPSCSLNDSLNECLNIIKSFQKQRQKRHER